jgi:hypothetical protein
VRIFLATLVLLALTLCKKKEEPVDQPLLAVCFDTDTLFRKVDEPIRFTNCSVNYDRLEWNFGDGQLSNETNPTHKWSKKGGYKVNLTVYQGSNMQSLSTAVVIADSVEVGYWIKLKNLPLSWVNDTTIVSVYLTTNSQRKLCSSSVNSPKGTPPSYEIWMGFNPLFTSKDPASTYTIITRVFNKNRGIPDSVASRPINILINQARFGRTVPLTFFTVWDSLRFEYR